MQVSGICHFNLRAPRELLDALRDFYCDIVGLSVGARPAFSSFGYWLYAGSKDVLHLTEARPGEQRCTGRAATFDHVAFACTDAAAYRVRLQAAGIAFTTDTVPGTGQLQMFFTDPAGNGVEINFAGSADASVRATV
ncbi:MAG: VOC family protein [Lysobacterales bacterium]